MKKGFAFIAVDPFRHYNQTHQEKAFRRSRRREAFVRHGRRVVLPPAAGPIACETFCLFFTSGDER
jgi:hypothetical protein